MNCNIQTSCPFNILCNHKDLAEFCSYHRLNYVDPADKEFKPAVYLNLNNPPKEPYYDKIRENKMKNPMDPYEKEE